MFNPYYRNIIYRNNNINPLLRHNVRQMPSQSLTKNMIPQISKFIETTERGINTYNQIVPIYKEIKPIVVKIGETGKKVISFINKINNKNPIRNNNVINDVSETIIKNETKPSSPFFY